ncbi:MAG: SDR family NAD(P)-dependent oxidoreductase [Opitutaceae bacterium]|nr:SDR family NAD(P)-dependent oxidoreductase [Opitutaceae bacterium]
MVILITGVTRGLGRALAEWYIAHGHTIVGCGRKAAELMDLRFTYPEPHDFSVVDVTEDNKVAMWAERVLARQGPPDFLINNAGAMHTPAPLWKVPAPDFARVIDVNIKGVANVIRHFVPAMVERKSGVIVNISSAWGRSTSREVAPYCASKFAIEGLTKALAKELPAGMAAVPLAPGIINTDMLQQCFGAGADQHPKASEWVERAAPFILTLGAKDNGDSLSVPEAG